MITTRLETHNLSIGYHSRSSRPPLANGLNLRLPAGKLTCLIGPNGVGKSTLLRTLAGLQKPLGGEVMVDRREICQFTPEELARQIGIVLTNPSHPGDLRVEQVVELGRLPYTNWLGTLSDQDHQIVRQSLDQMDARAIAGKSFGELSDGERQKIMIARALAQQTAVMILDEPTAFLDWPNRVAMLIKLKELAATTGKAILLSSHDLELVCQMADELWVMGLSGVLSCGDTRELVDSGLLEEVFKTPSGRFYIRHWFFQR